MRFREVGVAGAEQAKGGSFVGGDPAGVACCLIRSLGSRLIGPLLSGWGMAEDVDFPLGRKKS